MQPDACAAASNLELTKHLTTGKQCALDMWRPVGISSAVSLAFALPCFAFHSLSGGVQHCLVLLTWLLVFEVYDAGCCSSRSTYQLQGPWP
jgi:hypothetical protein